MRKVIATINVRHHGRLREKRVITADGAVHRIVAQPEQKVKRGRAFTTDYGGVFIELNTASINASCACASLRRAACICTSRQ